MLNISTSNFFEKSPMHSPTKILRTLDLLSVNGQFVPKSGEISPACLTPTRYRKITDKNRRKSLNCDAYFHHIIEDEFSQIQLNVTERRFSCEKFISPKSKDFTNKIVIAKVIKGENDDDDDEIEIIDLNDDEELPPQKPGENLYPQTDVNVWLRSCEKEIIEPINGVVKGQIPEWINGSLLRNGPGSIKVGDSNFKHLFDSSALLHRFNIENGNVTYQCSFLKSETYKKNLAANRIVTTEFGTVAVPDPCQSIFQRVSSLFNPADSNSDNAMISIYPFNDEYFAFAESPVIHKIDVESLDTLKRVNLHEKLGIINHTSHPHVTTEAVYNVGLTLSKGGPAYAVICFPHGENIFENAHIVAEVPARWKLHPCYMHTFGITESFFIIVEQPLTVSIPAVVKSQITNEPMISCLKWFGDKLTCFYLVDRCTGELKHTFYAETFFFLHIINQYEKDDHLVIDISCYKDPEMLNCMYIESMKEMQHNPDYAKMFRGRPLRFVMPLKSTPNSKSFTNFFSWTCESNYDKFENLVKLKDVTASAYQMPDGTIFCKPELLCNIGCETPRIHYERFLGKEYQFFYAISSDVDAENPGTLIKVDTINKTKLTWCEKNVYPSEPIFIPRRPSQDPQSEDDGVILASMVWGQGEENRVGLLVLNAKDMTEMGRCEFNDLPGPAPKCLHGWFAPKN